MPQCIVVADDLTGANATGVLLKKDELSDVYGDEFRSVWELALFDSCDCVMYPTDSRGVSSSLAYKLHIQRDEFIKGRRVKVYAKRIDSTTGKCGEVRQRQY